jgi:hypothetical protein
MATLASATAAPSGRSQFIEGIGVIVGLCIALLPALAHPGRGFGKRLPEG